MRAPFLLLLCTAGLLSSACATGGWRPAEMIALGAAESAVAADCGTTVVALRDAQLYETNPLLGANPSTPRIAATCAVAGLAVWAVAERTHGVARWVWLGAVFGVGVLNATHNWNVIQSQKAVIPPASLRVRLSF